MSSLPNGFVAPIDFNLFSYAVPKEVGKVGRESPTFIEPVANRKDGIEAMFSKQRDAGSSSKPAQDVMPSGTSPGKTKRKCKDSLGAPQKKIKADRETADVARPLATSFKEEDRDSDVEIVSPPSHSQVSALSSIVFVFSARA